MLHALGLVPFPKSPNSFGEGSYAMHAHYMELLRIHVHVAMSVHGFMVANAEILHHCISFSLQRSHDVTHMPYLGCLCTILQRDTMS